MTVAGREVDLNHGFVFAFSASIFCMSNLHQFTWTTCHSYFLKASMLIRLLQCGAPKLLQLKLCQAIPQQNLFFLPVSAESVRSMALRTVAHIWVKSKSPAIFALREFHRRTWRGLQQLIRVEVPSPPVVDLIGSTRRLRNEA